MDFDAFLAAAWAEHSERPEAVARRLAAEIHRVAEPAQVPPWVALVVHLHAEHLSPPQPGATLLEALRQRPVGAADATTLAAIARGVATLRHLGGDRAALRGLGDEDRAAVLATIAAAHTSRHELNAALASLREALVLAPPGADASSPASRALAVAGNNLAQALEEKAQRTATEARGMVLAAEAGLRFWRIAGTWLEEERAEYRLARCLLADGQLPAALEHARRCVAICTQRTAGDFELFFGHAVVALALRAAGDASGAAASRQAALACHARLADADRSWCQRELAELAR